MAHGQWPYAQHTRHSPTPSKNTQSWGCLSNQGIFKDSVLLEPAGATGTYSFWILLRMLPPVRAAMPPAASTVPPRAWTRTVAVDSSGTARTRPKAAASRAVPRRFRLPGVELQGVREQWWCYSRCCGVEVAHGGILACACPPEQQFWIPCALLQSAEHAQGPGVHCAVQGSDGWRGTQPRWLTCSFQVWRLRSKCTAEMDYRPHSVAACTFIHEQHQVY